MKDGETFHDFQNIYKTSKLHTGIDNIPLTDDNITQMGKDLWLEIMNDDNCENSMITFQEYI